MARPGSTLHPLAQSGLTSLARLGLTFPLAAGPWAATCAGAAVGRFFASARFNRKRVNRALEHLAQAFPEWPQERRRRYAALAYEHMFKLGVELTFTPRLLNEDSFLDRVALGELTLGVQALLRQGPCVLVTGHCGNWEVLGYTLAMLGVPVHALYRPLDLKPLDSWVRAARQRRGLVLIDKFGAVGRLPQLLADGKPVAFVADQNAGDRGLFVPYFGRLASTYKAVGLAALQFDATVICGMARRLEEGEAVASRRGGVSSLPGFHYRIELFDVIRPQDWKSQPDPLFYLTARYRRALESMVRRAPEQYLWMHRMWKSRPRHERAGKPFPKALRDKLASLPWMTASELDAIIARSDADAAAIALAPHK